MRSWLRTWLGIEDMSYVQDSTQASIDAMLGSLHAIIATNQEIVRKSETLKDRLAQVENAALASAKPSKAAKPYRTASEIRNKLERSTEEKA